VDGEGKGREEGRKTNLRGKKKEPNSISLPGGKRESRGLLYELGARGEKRRRKRGKEMELF